VQHLAETRAAAALRYTHGPLVLELTATLTDEALNMFEHLVGQVFKRSETRPRPSSSTASGKSINEKVRLYARVGPKRSSRCVPAAPIVFAAIEGRIAMVQVLSRPWLKRKTLAQPEEI